MAQVYNPYLPLWEHIPDGEPHLFDGRVYIYGSHDRVGGTKYCEDHYTVWSAPENDLSDWRCDGISYLRWQDPSNSDDSMELYAPDVTKGPDGRYYLYYAFSKCLEIGVAVSDSPAGPFEYYGHVHYPKHIRDGADLHEFFPFDPAVLTDDDNRVYLYFGFTPSGEKADVPVTPLEKDSRVVELETDMLTMKEEPRIFLPSEKTSKGTSFEGHGFFEASSIRKFNGKYYFVYSSHKSHELCYATSDLPDRDFVYGGTLISNGDIGLNGATKPINVIGNNHGGIVQANGQYYIFYHRQTGGTEYFRQGCAEKLTMREDGGFDQVEITSCGLNGGALYASGSYPSAIACHIRSKKSIDCIDYDNPDVKVQTRITDENNESFITAITAGTTLGYKYFAFHGASMVTVEVRGSYDGNILLCKDPKGKRVIGEADLHIQSGDWSCELIPLVEVSGTTALYFLFDGKGSLDLKSFSFIAM